MNTLFNSTFLGIFIFSLLAGFAQAQELSSEGAAQIYVESEITSEDEMMEAPATVATPVEVKPRLTQEKAPIMARATEEQPTPVSLKKEVKEVNKVKEAAQEVKERKDTKRTDYMKIGLILIIIGLILAILVDPSALGVLILVVGLVLLLLELL
ncbi:MAG: hypothetical protein ACFB0B_05120 [Thermonemataceae bacterium]